MKILMLETRLGVADGFTTKRYSEGEEYTVPDSLGTRFVKRGVAVCKDEPYDQKYLDALNKSIVGAL